MRQARTSASSCRKSAVSTCMLKLALFVIQAPSMPPQSPLAHYPLWTGRYHKQLEPLRAYFTESRFSATRIAVEIRWLLALAAEPALAEIKPFSKDTTAELERIIASVLRGGRCSGEGDRGRNQPRRQGDRIRLRKRLAGNPEGARVAGFVHFACTSEDTNNLAYGLMLREGAGPRVLLPALDRVIETLAALARQLAGAAMLARTHGQPASPNDARQGACERRSSPAARAALDSLGVHHGEDQRRRGQLQRPPSPRIPISTGRASLGRSSSLSVSNSIPTPSRSSRTTASPSSSTRSRAPTPCSSIWTAICGATSRWATSSRKRKRAKSAPRPCRTRSIRSTSRIPRAISESPTRCCDIFPRSFRCRAGSAISRIRRC